MALLAAVNITTADSDVLVYTVPTGKVATAQINICNRNNVRANVSIGLTAGTVPADANWIEFRSPLDPFSPLERAPQRFAAGERIYVRSSVAGVSVVVTGETATPQE